MGIKRGIPLLIVPSLCALAWSPWLTIFIIRVKASRKLILERVLSVCFHFYYKNLFFNWKGIFIKERQKDLPFVATPQVAATVAIEPIQRRSQELLLCLPCVWQFWSPLFPQDLDYTNLSKYSLKAMSASCSANGLGNEEVVCKAKRSSLGSHRSGFKWTAIC